MQEAHFPDDGLLLAAIRIINFDVN